MEEIEKKCAGECGLIKNIIEFSYRKDTKKYRSICKLCKKIQVAKYLNENKEKIAEQTKIYYNNNKEKFSLLNKEYRNDPKNKETIKAGKNKYYEENKEEVAKKQAEYNKKNRSKINKRKRNRRKEDPNYRLTYHVSNDIRKYLNKSGNKKYNISFLEKIGYEIQDLKSHLESLFEPWMNWENQGNYSPKTWNDEDQSTWKWQLDHIIPCSDFNYSTMDDEDFKKCWALSNLRPYSAKQNVLDGTGRTRHKK